MLLRLLGIFLVLVGPSLTSAQWLRGRTVTRSRACTNCCANNCVGNAAIVPVAQTSYTTPVAAVPVTTVIPSTTYVQPASCVQPVYVPASRTIQRTRVRVIQTSCATPCAGETIVQPGSVIVGSESAPVTPSVVEGPTPLPLETTSIGGPSPVIPSIGSPVVESYPTSAMPVWGEVPTIQPTSYATYSRQAVSTATCMSGNCGGATPASYVGGMAQVSNALAVVNQRRASRGLYPLSFDPTLTAAAQRKSQTRANRRMTGHDGSYKAGATAEGVGFAYGGGNLNSRFQACHLYSTGFRRAGAAIAYDNRGAAYYTLLLR